MRLLIVEDNPRISDFLSKGLREEGYSVEAVANGAAGYDLALREEFDAAVVDVMLPGRDGISIVRDLRGAGSSLPVLLLTARDAVEDKIAGLDAGADDYLTKPFDFPELTARLRALVRRSGPPAPAVLEVAGIEVDPATRQVRRNGEPVSVTPREFSLLEFLMRHPDRALSRTMIMEQVWGIRFDPGTNVVDVFINSLRNKVDPERAHIRTIRGVGYMLGSQEEQ